MKDAFISYAFDSSSQTRDSGISKIVRDLQDSLVKRNYETHKASPHEGESSLGSGNWRSEICKHIKDSNRVILLLDDKSTRSQECFIEILLAQGLGKPIHAFYIEQGPIPRPDDVDEDQTVLRFLLATEHNIHPCNVQDEAEYTIASTVADTFVKNRENDERDNRDQQARRIELVKRIATALRELSDADGHSPDTEFRLIRKCLFDIGRLITPIAVCDKEDNPRAENLLEAVFFAARASEPESHGKAGLKKVTLTNVLLDLGKFLKSDLQDQELVGIIEDAARFLPNPGRGTPPPAEPRILVDINNDVFETQRRELTDYVQPAVEHYLRSAQGLAKTLTPVLGTGALQLRGRTSDHAERSCDEDIIAWDSSVDDHAAASDGDLDGSRSTFLADILETRSDGRSRYQEREAAPEVSRVRIALFELAYVATQTFLRVLAENPAPIADWEDLDISLRVEEATGLLEACEEARTALFPQGPAVDCMPPLLGAGDLKVKLHEFAKQLTDDDGDARRETRLSGKRVEWITDVFWHSMIFDSPLYPRMDELALQIALVDGSTGGVRFRYPLQRLEPSASVYRFNVPSFTETARNCVARGFTEDPHYADYVRATDVSMPDHSPRRAFYAALADTLMGDFDAWERHSSRMSRQPDAVPIAIVATFDLEFERALMCTSGKEWYHVALPVLVRQDDGRAELRWIVGTFPTATPSTSWDTSSRVEVSDWAPSSGPRASNQIELLRKPNNPEHWQWLDQMERVPETDDIRWKGPLVLRINGSPLHELPDDTSEIDAADSLVNGSDSEPQAIYHAVSLAEFDFLQTSRSHIWANSSRLANRGSKGDSAVRQGLPTKITQALRHTNRYWMLAGYRLVDWNSRMQLFMYLPEHLRHTANQRSSNAIAINKVIDPDRVRVLTWLGIEPYRGNLSILTEWLTEYATSRSDNGEQEA